MQRDVTPPAAANKTAQILRVRYARKPLGTKKRIAIWAIIISLFFGICGLGFYKITHSSQAYIDSSKYQAVFVTNNQAYFGKLSRLTDGGYRLTDVYYLQQASVPSAENPSQQPNAQQSPQLIKLGSELHGPEDAIVFDRHQVLFWENLTSDSKVTKAIQSYQAAPAR